MLEVLLDGWQLFQDFLVRHLVVEEFAISKALEYDSDSSAIFFLDLIRAALFPREVEG